MRILLLSCVLILLTGCASAPPPPIPLGAEVAPLMGCIELRERDGDC